MFQVSEQYAEAIRGPHRIVIRADVNKAGVRLYSGLPVTGGQVVVDSSQTTRRRLTLSVAPRLSTGTYTDRSSVPSSPDHPLAWYGQEITVRHGLVYDSGRIEWVPLGVFRIEEASGSLMDTGEVSVSAVSREAWVADDAFTSPRTLSGPSTTSLIRDLIVESYPSAEVAVLTRRDRRVTSLTVDTDRWAAIQTLATSAALVVYADPLGRFIIADAPTTEALAVYRFEPGQGGTMLDVSTSGSRADVYNAVAVSGATPDGGSSPIVGVRRDDTPTSPTRWGDPATGAFGRKTYLMADSSLTSLAACQAVAAAELAKRTGAAQRLDLSAVPHPGLEALDVVEVVPDPSDVAGTVRRHVVDSFTLPLVPGGEFTVATRDIGAAA